MAINKVKGVAMKTTEKPKIIRNTKTRSPALEAVHVPPSLHDKAFDRGLISFNDNLEMLLSPPIKKLKSAIYIEIFANYEGKKLRLPLSYPPDISQLKYHRNKIFIAE